MGISNICGGEMKKSLQFSSSILLPAKTAKRPRQPSKIEDNDHDLTSTTTPITITHLEAHLFISETQPLPSLCNASDQKTIRQISIKRATINNQNGLP